jgi:hypothetical protein
LVFTSAHEITARGLSDSAHTISPFSPPGTVRSVVVFAAELVQRANTGGRSPRRSGRGGWCQVAHDRDVRVLRTPQRVPEQRVPGRPRGLVDEIFRLVLNSSVLDGEDVCWSR